MDQEAIVAYIGQRFAGVDILRPTEGPGTGDTFFIYDPTRDLDVKRRFPFATIVTKNYGDFDNTSQLDRPGIFRLNVGVSRETFQRLFPSATSGTYDFSALDALMPHPVYGNQAWVCVLNPSRETFGTLEPLLAEAYARAVARIGIDHLAT